MYPKRATAPKGKGELAAAEPSAPVVLGVSRHPNEETLAKVRGLVGDASNKWGAIEVHPGYNTVQWRSGSLQPVYVHALIAGLVPPFSSFLLEILRHYQIHLLHLHPASIAIRATFSYLCEAFLSVRPSVAFFCHFYSLRMTASGELPATSPSA